MRKYLIAGSMSLVLLGLAGCATTTTNTTNTNTTSAGETKVANENVSTTETNETSPTTDIAASDIPTNSAISENTNTAAPTTKTFTLSELNYSIEYPADWVVDDQSAGNTTKQVSFSPTDAEPFISYVSIVVDPRYIDTIRSVYASTYTENDPVTINGIAPYQFTLNANPNHKEFFWPYGDSFLLVSTDKYDMSEVQQSINSFSVDYPREGE